MPYKDKDKQREYERIWKQKEQIRIRATVLEIFGSKCQKCGYNENTLALQIDHIEPILRNKEEKDGTNKLWKQIYSGKIGIEGLQMLCANCHVIKTLTIDIKKFKRSKPILRSGETVISGLS